MERFVQDWWRSEATNSRYPSNSVLVRLLPFKRMDQNHNILCPESNSSLILHKIVFSFDNRGARCISSARLKAISRVVLRNRELFRGISVWCGAEFLHRGTSRWDGAEGSAQVEE
jgi:hypothetical protein